MGKYCNGHIGDTVMALVSLTARTTLSHFLR